MGSPVKKFLSGLLRWRSCLMQVYIWRYDSSSKEPPVVILKTKRTLRGLHFHPTLPLLLTAEVRSLPLHVLFLSFSIRHAAVVLEAFCSFLQALSMVDPSQTSVIHACNGQAFSQSFPTQIKASPLSPLRDW